MMALMQHFAQAFYQIYSNGGLSLESLFEKMFDIFLNSLIYPVN